MSRYLDLLKGKKTENYLVGEAPKPPKPGFDGFEGSPDARSRENAHSAETEEHLPGELIKPKHPDKSSEPLRNNRNAALFVNRLPEHQREVVGMLLADSALKYAFTMRFKVDVVIVTLGIRDVAVVDIAIPAINYDAMGFWETIDEVTHGK